VHETGFEPVTFGVSCRCSTRLSHTCRISTSVQNLDHGGPPSRGGAQPWPPAPHHPARPGRGCKPVLVGRHGRNRTFDRPVISRVHSPSVLHAVGDSGRIRTGMTRFAISHLTIRTPSHGVADGIRTRPFCLASRNAAANTTATWCTRTDSNRGPTPCEGGALPLSYGCMKDSVGKERNWTGWWFHTESNRGPRDFTPVLYQLSYRTMNLWSGRRDSNPHLLRGRQTCYH
jgi:hypothetical protein